jgi:hypothetical protein
MASPKLPFETVTAPSSITPCERSHANYRRDSASSKAAGIDR